MIRMESNAREHFWKAAITARKVNTVVAIGRHSSSQFAGAGRDTIEPPGTGRAIDPWGELLRTISEVLDIRRVFPRVSEIANRVRRDPNYLSRMHMRLLGAHDEEISASSVDWSRSPNFTARQDAGTWNALGNLKIDMPNRYSVYMHDTDARKLFADDYRFDSHGCTRVDNVRDLAAWILQDNPPGWDRTAIDAGIATGQTKIINLPHKIPVAWVYLTGWVTRDGTVEFRDDVYKHDEQLDRAALDDAAAGGFVAPVSQTASHPPPQPAPQSLAPVTQASGLDSR